MFIVSIDEYDEIKIIGVVSTEEDAVEFVDRLNSTQQTRALYDYKPIRYFEPGNLPQVKTMYEYTCIPCMAPKGTRLCPTEEHTHRRISITKEIGLDGPLPEAEVVEGANPSGRRHTYFAVRGTDEDAVRELYEQHA